jgi:MFS family permease
MERLGGLFRSATAEAARPAWIRDHPRAPWAAVGAVCIGAFMGQLDASIVTLTYPRLQREFGAGLGDVQWVSLSYLVVLAVLLVPVGRWSDARGRKLLYLYGFAAFTLASGACALAPSLAWLVAARAGQGVGAALLQANSVALVVCSVPRARMRAALGAQAAAQALGLALGPTVGGLLVGASSWRAVFWVNAPVGVVAIAAGWFLLPRSRSRAEPTGLDLPGFALLSVAAVTGLLALSGLAGMDQPALLTAALGVAAVVAVGALTRVESSSRSPLIDPALLRSKGVSASLAGALLAYLVLFAPLVLFPTVFARWTLGPGLGGLVLSCLPLGFAIAAVGSNLLTARLPNRRRVLLGGVGATASLLVGAVTWTSPGAVAVVLLALGASLGLAIPANNARIMGAIPRETSAVAGGMVNVARAVGTALGVALTVVVLHAAAAHGWSGPPVVLSLLACCSIALAVTR